MAGFFMPLSFFWILPVDITSFPSSGDPNQPRQAGGEATPKGGSADRGRLASGRNGLNKSFRQSSQIILDIWVRMSVGNASKESRVIVIYR
jgi:hypothetical protein